MLPNIYRIVASTNTCYYSENGRPLYMYMYYYTTTMYRKPPDSTVLVHPGNCTIGKTVLIRD